MSMQQEFFDHLAVYGLVVCKECRYAVWPKEIEGHLHGKHHRLPRKEAQQIAEEIYDWPGLIPFASELEVPFSVDIPIPQLALFDDGLKCHLKPGRCSYICREKRTLISHWRTEHGWSIMSKRGGSGKAKREKMKREFEQASKRVYCQRFFPMYHGSQYFEVRRLKEAQRDQTRVIREGLWSRIQEEAQKSWQEAVRLSQEKIKEGEPTDGNPWLDRTGWAKYLKNVDKAELLSVIEEPQFEERVADRPDNRQG
jgi:uncharacterized C2H2 Zn-finger protein